MCIRSSYINIGMVKKAHKFNWVASIRSSELGNSEGPVSHAQPMLFGRRHIASTKSVSVLPPVRRSRNPKTEKRNRTNWRREKSVTNKLWRGIVSAFSVLSCLSRLARCMNGRAICTKRMKNLFCDLWLRWWRFYFVRDGVRRLFVFLYFIMFCFLLFFFKEKDVWLRFMAVLAHSVLVPVQIQRNWRCAFFVVWCYHCDLMGFCMWLLLNNWMLVFMVRAGDLKNSLSLLDGHTRHTSSCIRHISLVLTSLLFCEQINVLFKMLWMNRWAVSHSQLQIAKSYWQMSWWILTKIFSYT